MGLKIQKKSPLTGEWNIMELDITREQWNRWYKGEHVQDVMPHLTPDEREFLISGCMPGEYEQLFGPEEEEDHGYDEDDEAPF